MKNTIKTFAILVLTTIAGCNKAVDSAYEDTLSISVPQKTKVHMEGLKTCWDAGDELTVFYKSTVGELWHFMGKTGDVNGQITHESTSREETRKDIFVVYPYDEDAVLEGNMIHTEIPSEQTCRQDSYGTALLASRSFIDILQMKYCTAIIELRYDGPAEISHIVLSGGNGEKISGQCTISFNGEEPSTSCAGETTVRLDCNTKVENGKTGSFYFSIAPGTFSKGVVFMVHLQNGETHKVTASEEISVAPGHVRTIQIGSPSSPQDQLEMYLLFSDGAQQIHPFTQPISFVRDTRKEYQFKIGSITYPFYLYCQSNDNYQFRNTAKGGLYIGGTEGDYIEFPAVPGYRLFRMGISANKESYFHIVPTDDPSVTVEGGSCTAMLDTSFRILNLSGTQEGKSYTMMLDNNAVFRFITLYYCR